MAEGRGIAALPGQFERRNCETRDRITTLIRQATSQPNQYRSYPQYCRSVAAAYQARERFYADLIAHAMRHGPGGLWFTVLLDAHAGCRTAAQAAHDTALQAARWDQEQAWLSYAENVAVAT